MRRTILSILALLLLGAGANAATVNFGPKVGGNCCWLTKVPRDVLTQRVKMSGHGGAYAEIVFKECGVFRGLLVEALLNAVGNKMDSKTPSDEKTEKTTNKVNLHYLIVPALGKFHLPNIAGFSFYLGPQVAFLMRAKVLSKSKLKPQESDSPIKKGDDITIVTKKNTKDSFKDIDVAIVGGAEYAFNFGLVVGARYNYGVLDTSKTSDKTSDNNKNQCIQAYVGYNLAKVFKKQ